VEAIFYTAKILFTYLPHLSSTRRLQVAHRTFHVRVAEPLLHGPQIDASPTTTCKKRKCRKQAEAMAKKERKEREAKKYFCGPVCKGTARFAIKTLPVPAKPGVGLFVPVAGGDCYQNYLKFCMLVGTTPLDETQWRMALR
jgi:hypothetical protein